MASYSVRIKASAARELEGLPRADRRRMVRRVAALADDGRLPGREKLSGQEKYRLRQGDYRVLYAVDDDALQVMVVKIGHRREVYR